MTAYYGPGHLRAQDIPVNLDNVPRQVVSCQKALGGTYRISRRMNPFYLRADFDGDARADYVVLITEAATKKEGFTFCFGESRKKPVVVGAGVRIRVEGGTPVDDFKGIDLWGIASDCGNQKHDCLFIEEAEAGSGYFIWNGRRAIWRQAAI